MQKLKALFLCWCIVLSLFIVAEGKAQQLNKPLQMPELQIIENEEGLPDILSPIGNLFKRFLGKKRIIREYSPEIKNVYLSQTKVIKKKSLNKQNGGCSETDQSIIVTTDVYEHYSNPLLYQYKVSGGEILGRASTIVWNLSKVQAGNYSITVGVDDGCGVCHPTVTKEVQVIECE